MDFYGYQNTLHPILDEPALAQKLAKIKKYLIVDMKHFQEIQKKTEELDKISGRYINLFLYIIKSALLKYTRDGTTETFSCWGMSLVNACSPGALRGRADCSLMFPTSKYFKQKPINTATDGQNAAPLFCFRN